MPKPVINKNKCTECGTCIEVCPMEIFVKKGDKVIIDPKKVTECIGCRACEVQCPQEAIAVKD